MTLTFDLLTLKMVSESRVTWATSVPILAFLGLSVLDLYGTDRQSAVRRASSFNAPYPRGGGIIKQYVYSCSLIDRFFAQKHSIGLGLLLSNKKRYEIIYRAAEVLVFSVRIFPAVLSSLTMKACLIKL